MIRKKCTSNNNILFVMCGFCTKSMLEIDTRLRPKFDHISSVTDGFWFCQLLSAQFFDADPPGTAPGSRKIVFGEFWWDHGAAWKHDVSWTHLFLQRLLRKSNFVRSRITIIPHAQISGVLRIAYMQWNEHVGPPSGRRNLLYESSPWDHGWRFTACSKWIRKKKP